MIIKDAYDLTDGITFDDKLGIFSGDLPPNVVDINNVPNGSIYLQTNAGFWHKKGGIWIDLSVQTGGTGGGNSTYIGDLASGNHTLIGTQGHLKKQGVPYYNTIRSELLNGNANVSKLSLHSELPLGSGMLFDGISSFMNIPTSNQLIFDRYSFSVAFWVEPHSTADSVIFEKRKGWTIGITNGFLYVDMYKNDIFVSNTPINVNSKSCVILIVETINNVTNIKMYLNNVLVINIVNTRRVDDRRKSVIYVGSDRKQTIFFNGILDEIRIWNAALNNVDVNNYFNAGKGTTLNNSATLSLIVKYSRIKPNGLLVINGTGNTSLDIILSLPKPAITYGLVGYNSFPNFSTLSMPANKFSEIFFTAFLPRGWKHGTSIIPTIDWFRERGNVSSVATINLEYSIANIGEIIPNSQLLSLNLSTTAPVTHHQSDFSEMIHLGSEESAMIVGRIYRDGTDTCQDSIAVCSLGFKISTESIGSNRI